MENRDDEPKNPEPITSESVIPEAIIPASWTPEAELLLLFGGEESGGGAYMAKELENTLIYMVYKPALEPSKRSYEWEQYDRIEVDMYKRTGQWSNNKNELVTVKLPEDFESSEYWVCFYLRNDASKDQIGPGKEVHQVNGGTVKTESRRS